MALGAALLGGASAGAAPTAPPPQGHNEVISQIDLRDVTVGDALRILSEETGLNIVASEKAAKIRTALYLRNSRPRDILQTIARTYNLWYQEDPQSHIIRIYTAEEFRLGEVDSQTERTEIFTLRYPNPVEVAYSIQNLFGDRVYLTLGTNQDRDNYQELQERFRRFDVINSRSQTIGTIGTSGGGGGGSGGGGSGGGSQGAGATGGGTGPTTRPGSGTAGPAVSAQDIEGFYSSGEAMKKVGSLVAGAEGEGKSALGEVYRRLSPIYVTVIRNQNRLLVRSRDPQALEDIRDLVKKLDVSMSTLLMEVKVLRVELTDQFDSVFNFAVTAGSFAGTSILPGSDQITGALVASFVNSQFRGKLDLLEREGRVTALATPM
ncbi:MAG: hypothetical protein FJ189_14130, partial [Gammaproteobacteria bacterium]|nr:hypothetical protein [Gammaproteobacteria bacterium]